MERRILKELLESSLGILPYVDGQEGSPAIVRFLRAQTAAERYIRDLDELAAAADSLEPTSPEIVIPVTSIEE